MRSIIESTPNPENMTMISNEFKVGNHTCKLTIDEKAIGACDMQSEWFPDVPKKFNEKMWSDYRSGRQNLMNEVSKALGGEVLCVEV